MATKGWLQGRSRGEACPVGLGSSRSPSLPPPEQDWWRSFLFHSSDSKWKRLAKCNFRLPKPLAPLSTALGSHNTHMARKSDITLLHLPAHNLLSWPYGAVTGTQQLVLLIAWRSAFYHRAHMVERDLYPQVAIWPVHICSGTYIYINKWLTMYVYACLNSLTTSWHIYYKIKTKIILTTCT